MMENISREQKLQPHRHILVDLKPDRITLREIQNAMAKPTHKVKLVKTEDVKPPLQEPDGEDTFMALRVSGMSKVEEEIQRLNAKVDKLTDKMTELEAMKMGLYAHDLLQYLNLKLSHKLQQKLNAIGAWQSNEWFNIGKPFENLNEPIDFNRVLSFFERKGLHTFRSIHTIAEACCQELAVDLAQCKDGAKFKLRGDHLMQHVLCVRNAIKPFRIGEAHKFCVMFERLKPLSPYGPPAFYRQYDYRFSFTEFEFVGAKIAAEELGGSINNLEQFEGVFRLTNKESDLPVLKTTLQAARELLLTDLQNWLMQQDRRFQEAVRFYENPGHCAVGSGGLQNLGHSSSAWETVPPQGKVDDEPPPPGTESSVPR